MLERRPTSLNPGGEHPSVEVGHVSCRDDIAGVEHQTPVLVDVDRGRLDDLAVDPDGDRLADRVAHLPVLVEDDAGPPGRDVLEGRVEVDEDPGQHLVAAVAAASFDDAPRRRGLKLLGELVPGDPHVDAYAADDEVDLPVL